MVVAGVIAAAILVLAPAKVASIAVLYSGAILQSAEVQGIDPLLVVSLIHVETGGRWESDLVSPTNDYGLTQTHVSRTTNKEFLDREEDLLDPATNIGVGVSMLAYWKKYHSKHCGGNSHKWWSHYKWGTEVKNSKYGRKVYRVYARLKRRVHLLCDLGGRYDSSYRGVGCLRQEYTDQSSREVAASISENLIPAIRLPVWTSDQKTSNGESSAIRERSHYDYGALGAISRRRRRFSSLDDNG